MSDKPKTPTLEYHRSTDKESKLIDAWRGATKEEREELLEFIFNEELENKPAQKLSKLCGWLCIQLRWMDGEWKMITSVETAADSTFVGVWQLPDGAAFRHPRWPTKDPEFKERKLETWKLAGEWAKANNEEAYRAWLEIENGGPNG